MQLTITANIVVICEPKQLIYIGLEPPGTNQICWLKIGSANPD